MSQARTARRRRKQMTQNNNHLSGLGVPRFKMPEKQIIRSPGAGKRKQS